MGKYPGGGYSARKWIPPVGQCHGTPTLIGTTLPLVALKCAKKGPSLS